MLGDVEGQPPHEERIRARSRPEGWNSELSILRKLFSHFTEQSRVSVSRPGRAWLQSRVMCHVIVVVSFM